MNGTVAKAGLLTVLVILNVAFVVGWVAARRSIVKRDRPTLWDAVIGFGTCFFDALGIGSFATTTALFKLRSRPADELIPGTLLIGTNAPAFLETVIFVTAVAVDPLLLVAMIASAAVGGWLGAGVVSRLPRQSIQLFMGIALLVAVCFFVVGNLGAFPAGGTTLALGGWRFTVAIAVNFVLGAVATVGIGPYAPTMVLLSLLGLHPLAMYPIMMATCGIVQPVAGLRFFRTGRFAWGPALGLTLGGTLGVLIAVSFVVKLPLATLRWLVVVVIAYAAFSMLRSALPLRAPRVTQA